MKNPLRYEISDWSDLNNCLSNNSRNLFIRVSCLLDHHIHGKLIEVRHSLYGTLFAAVVDAYGDMLSRDIDGKPIYPLSTDTILDQLAVFGFYVTYSPKIYLGGPQLLLLSSIQSLGYRLITTLNVQDEDRVYQKIVAFNANTCSDWLTYGNIVKFYEFKDRLSDGSALYVDAVPSEHGFKWDWLNYVATIEDILLSNARSDC